MPRVLAPMTFVQGCAGDRPARSRPVFGRGLWDRRGSARGGAVGEGAGRRVCFVGGGQPALGFLRCSGGERVRDGVVCFLLDNGGGGVAE